MLCSIVSVLSYNVENEIINKRKTKNHEALINERLTTLEKIDLLLKTEENVFLANENAIVSKDALEEAISYQEEYENLLNEVTSF